MANNLVNGEMLNYFLGKLDGKYMSNQQGYTTKECIVELRDDSNSDNYYVAQNGYFKFCNIKIPNNTYTEILIKVTSLDGIENLYKYKRYGSDSTTTNAYVYNLDLLTVNNNNGSSSIGCAIRLEYINKFLLYHKYNVLSDGSIDLYISKSVNSGYIYTRYKLLIQVSIENKDNNYITLFNSTEPDIDFDHESSYTDLSVNYLT